MANGSKASGGGKGPAVIFELEMLGANGRQAILAVLKDLFGKQANEAVVSRYAADLPADRLLAQVAAGLGQAGDKAGNAALEKFTDALDKLLSKAGQKPDARLTTILEAAEEHECGVGMVSCLGRKSAEALVAALGWEEREWPLVADAANDENMGPAMEAWREVARRLGSETPRCVAVVSSSPSCKAALAAGMHVVALPDRFTSFEDFSGADYLLEDVSGDVIAEILTIVARRQ
jgi:beta-phosphoglucomutase-like phosphatase (HAD superfamily)